MLVQIEQQFHIFGELGYQFGSPYQLGDVDKYIGVEVRVLGEFQLVYGFQRNIQCYLLLEARTIRYRTI